jgi:hypothetical protein
MRNGSCGAFTGTGTLRRKAMGTPALDGGGRRYERIGETTGRLRRGGRERRTGSRCNRVSDCAPQVERSRRSCPRRGTGNGVHPAYRRASKPGGRRRRTSSGRRSRGDRRALAGRRQPADGRADRPDSASSRGLWPIDGGFRSSVSDLARIPGAFATIPGFPVQLKCSHRCGWSPPSGDGASSAGGCTATDCNTGAARPEPAATYPVQSAHRVRTRCSRRVKILRTGNHRAARSGRRGL